jgi:hypothetical protein
MNKTILIAIFIGSLVLFIRDDIDYNHKLFDKEVENLWGFKTFSKEELQLADSVAGFKDMNGKFFKLIGENNIKLNKYAYIGRVNSCRAGGCSISREIEPEAETEYFDYFILFDENLNVEMVRIFNYQATHGHEVTAKGWLKQFIGFSGTSSLEVGKNVDGISGATISVYAITYDVQIKTLILNKLIKKSIL